MKNPNKQEPEKTESNGKGDFSPKSDKIRCKCTHDCCCPNSKYYKGPTNKKLNKEDNLRPLVKKKVSVPELEYSKCPCADRKVTGKGKKFSKSKLPCNKDQDCSCTLPTALSLRHKITDLDNALKTHGRGKKRKTKNIQQKSIQISEVYVDPETKKKSIITLTEKSQVKIEIKTFCDDTQKLEKNKKKKKGKKGSDVSSKSSKKEKKSKEKKPKKEKRSKDKKPKKSKQPKEKKQKNQGGFCGCFRKKRPASAGSKSTYGSKRVSDVSVLFQTASEQKACKDGPCLGIKAFSKTEKTGEGIINTNTVVFPENFTGNLNELGGCSTCKEITSQINQQAKEINNIRNSVGECLKILKSSGQAVYMMSDMTERSNPNYYTVYSHASKKYHKKADRDCKVSEYTYDPEYKVRDWITHASSKHHHESKQVSRNAKDRDTKRPSHNRGSRTLDKFDAELEEYLKICRHEYQVYKTTKEAKPRKEKGSKSKTSKSASKNTKKSRKGSFVVVPPFIQGPQCDRDAADCQCGPECANLAVQTSNVSTDPSKDKKSDKKSKKGSKKDKKEKGKKSDIGESSSATTVKSEGDSVVSSENKDPKEKDKTIKDLKPKKPLAALLAKFMKCILCRPY